MAHLQKWARKCSITGNGMNSGWVWGEGTFYTSTDKVTLTELRKDILKGDVHYDSEISTDELLAMGNKRLLSWAYDNEILYYTEWEDDWQHIELNGILYDYDEDSDEQPEGMEFVEEGDGVEHEIWSDSKGAQYKVPIEIVRDFKNMEKL